MNTYIEPQTSLAWECTVEMYTEKGSVLLLGLQAYESFTLQNYKIQSESTL